jgi:sialic acid synthase SpsE
LDAINAKRKPVIVSIGMATIAEIGEAVSRLGDCDLTLLKCTAAYPARAEDMNLDTLRSLRMYVHGGIRLFYNHFGLSDHSLSTIIPAVAVGMGATVIEKHLTFSRMAGGIDCDFSLEPAEFAEMVQNVRVAEKAIGESHFGPTESEKPNIIFRRSVFAVKDIKAGELFTRENVRVIRPGYGLHPSKYAALLGQAARLDYAAGEPIVETEAARDTGEEKQKGWYGVV